jgi:hypothetical protein
LERNFTTLAAAYGTKFFVHGEERSFPPLCPEFTALWRRRSLCPELTAFFG